VNEPDTLLRPMIARLAPGLPPPDRAGLFSFKPKFDGFIN
jgi:hypothetical protein